MLAGINLDEGAEIDDYVWSEVSLSHIREDVKKYRPQNTPMPNDLFLKFAIAKAANAFRLPNDVKLLHLNDVFKKDLAIWSSSPGLPWTNQGYKTKGQIRDDPRAIKQVRWFWHQVKKGEPVINNDCCAFKYRAVWDYPATMVFGEAVFALPLIEAYSRTEFPFVYDYNHNYETGVDGSRKLYEKMKGQCILGIDYKRFVQTVPEWIIRVAFDILFLNLNILEYQDYGVARVDWMVRMWDHIIDYFINTPIRLCNGENYRKKGAIPSGSYFTPIIGSIVNYILMAYVSIKEGNTLIGSKDRGAVQLAQKIE